MGAALCHRGVDGLPTKGRATVTTGPGSAAATFTYSDLTPCFTWSLRQKHSDLAASTSLSCTAHSQCLLSVICQCSSGPTVHSFMFLSVFDQSVFWTESNRRQHKSNLTPMTNTFYTWKKRAPSSCQ